MSKWDELTMAEKAEMMRIAVRNGITSLNDIKQKYNEFAEGGDTNDGMTGMMKSKLATAAHYGNPTARRMTNYDTRSYTWPGEYEYDRGIGEPKRGNVYVGSYGNLVTPHIQDTGNGLALMDNVWSPDNDQRSYMQSLKFDNENDARYFGEHYKEIAPMMNLYGKGGKIHIKPSKKGTFTAAAKKHGMGVQEFASRVLAHKENYSPAMVKKANFARNASKWHGLGGPLVETAMAHYYDGTTEPTQQMNTSEWSAGFEGYSSSTPRTSAAYAPSGRYALATRTHTLPELVVTGKDRSRSTLGKVWDAIKDTDLAYLDNPSVMTAAGHTAKISEVHEPTEAERALGNNLAVIGLAGIAGMAAPTVLSSLTPGSSFWMNPITQRMVAGAGMAKGFDAAANMVGGYGSWGEGVSDVVNQATGWNPQDSWWGQFLAESTNPGWWMNPSRAMTPVGRVGNSIEEMPSSIRRAYDNGTIWDAYTTFGGRLGNYGNNIFTDMWGTAARKFGLPDKARVPADVIRKIREDIHIDNGVVDLTGGKSYLNNPHFNATFDRGVVSHSKGQWDGADTYITPTDNFIAQTSGSLKSIEPSDVFSNGAKITELPSNVTLVSGDVEALNRAREAGMQTLSSPRLRRMYNEGMADYMKEKAVFNEQYANSSGLQRLMLKEPVKPKSRKWWPEYSAEMQRLQAQRGTPTLGDFRLLEDITGLNAGVAPISEYQNAIRQLNIMQNASIRDIMEGKVQQYVYPNGRVVDWDKVGEELGLINRAKYNKVFYDPASYVESNWQEANGIK